MPELPSIPKTVRVGHRTYRIEPLRPVSDLVERENRGAHCYESALIQVDNTVDNQRVAEVLLHEILHACWAVGNLPDEHEEDTVTVLSRQVMQIIQDNPKVWDWIAKNARAA